MDSESLNTMKHTVTIPETIVTLETKGDALPEGTMIQLSVPVKGLPVTPPVTPPVTLSGVEGVQNETPAPTPLPVPEPIEVPDTEELPVWIGSEPQPTLDRSYDPVEFRSSAKRSNLLGNAMTLGLSDADWTMVLNVRFVNFDTEQRIIGSATYSGAGSSLQIGTLRDGSLWIDTIGGMSTQDKVELNRWYEIAVSHHTNGLEKIYLDKKLIHQGHVPTFHSTADIYVGRWLNGYHDFDLKRVRIYQLLSDAEVGSLQ